MIPPAPEPKPYAIAILDLLGYKAHLWEAGAIKAQGLTNLYESLFLHLIAAENGTTFDGFHLTADNNEVMRVQESIRYGLFSDTMMLWAPPEKGQYLLNATGRVFMRSLGLGAPLRGAIAYGDCILDLEKGILIGYPLVEAVEAEKIQEWLGVGVLPSAARALSSFTGIVKYDVPIKRSQDRSEAPESCKLQHALAWHWCWEGPENQGEIYLTTALGSVSGNHRAKYNNALDFIRAVGLR